MYPNKENYVLFRKEITLSLVVAKKKHTTEWIRKIGVKNNVYEHIDEVVIPCDCRRFINCTDDFYFDCYVRLFASRLIYEFGQPFLNIGERCVDVVF